MVELLVIADDLTGATDTGAQFAGQGIPALVTTEFDYAFDHSSEKYSVIVVSTETRHLNAAEAAARVETVVRRASAAGIEHFYKKTDSTLRGNIGAELQALLRASGNRVLSFAPAFPQLGRFTRGGYQYVGDRLLQETSFAHDPLEPVTNSYIPAIIRRQSDISTRVVNLNAGEELIDPNQGELIVVFDAESEDDLRRVGERLKRERQLYVMAGSAGFAACLPKLLGLRTYAPKRLDCPTRMLAINGSLNEVSLRQAACAEAGGFAVVYLPPELLMTQGSAWRETASRIIAGIARYDAQGRDVMLRTVTHREDVCEYERYGERLGLDHRQLLSRLTENTAKLVGEVLAQTRFELLTVFGGDTLAAIIRFMGWRDLLPQREILPGVILVETVGEGKKMWLITKAGGFGPEDVLRQIKDKMLDAGC